MITKSKISALVFFVLFVSSSVSGEEVSVAADKNIPRGTPFQILQQQINELNSKLNGLFNQSCSEGQFVTGIDANGKIICGVVTIPQEMTYLMNCPRSDNDTGPVGTDPFNSSHANYKIEFLPQLIGGAITAIGVEISNVGNGKAHLELRDATTGALLATSEEKSTSALGWIEFPFTQDFIIDGRPLLANFVTTNDARIYNCADTVEFIPQGIIAYGMGLEDHLARSVIKISN